MSAGYAQRLSEYPNKGVCGLPENYDSQRAFAYKLERLFQLIKQSEYTVVLTGAGISTSAGIPDFRGPFGIWTREQRERERNKTRSKKKQKREDVNDTEQTFISFDTALPTYTHRALTHLIIQPPPPPDESSSDNGDSSKDNYQSRTYIHHIVTQNVDGLHRKTNLPRNKMSVLHGCIFTEICDTCNTEYVREYEIESIGLKHTGRKCNLGSCPGKLKDTLLDWESPLPQTDWDRAQEVCSRADLVLCLGTSLRIEPAGSLCTLPLSNDAPPSLSELSEDGKEASGGRKKKRSSITKEPKRGYAIVNLQPTPYDDRAALVIRGKVDDVMKGLMEKLGYGAWDER